MIYPNITNQLWDLNKKVNPEGNLCTKMLLNATCLKFLNIPSRTFKFEKQTFLIAQSHQSKLGHNSFKRFN